ncbi:uncharacterized protein LOC135468181 [Liolophura sinensis]|uniref:uncharacterized protein LOC135468181 n=1 Tax=Liolophura sinensis TaxID=3198878 RepID=UPI0031599214
MGKVMCGCMMLFFCVQISTVSWTLAQATTALPDPSRLGLPPVLTTTSYKINSSKPLVETAVEVEDLACGKSHLCNGSLGRYDNGRCFDCGRFRCKCDEECHIYGDCCVDMAIGQAPESREHHPPHVVCQRRYPKYNNDEAAKYIFMISSCPPDSLADIETVSKCEKADVYDYEQATPVTDLGTGLVYRNSFCAQCFGVQRYKVWTYNIKCQVGSSAEGARSKTELWELVLNDTQCTVTNSPPSVTPGKLRDCILETKRQCNETGLWEKYNKITEDLCRSYYNPVEYYDDKNRYRNVFCAMCNGAEVDRKKQCVYIPHSRIRPRPRTHFTQPLSVLIDFNAESVADDATSYSTESRCPTGQIFNPLTASCIALSCSQRRLLNGEACEPLYQSIQGLGYSFSLAVTPLAPVLANATEALYIVYQKRLNSALNKFQPLSFTTILFDAYSKSPVSNTVPRLLSVVKVQGYVISNAGADIYTMEQALRDLDTMAVSAIINNVEVPFQTRFMSCPEYDPIMLEGNLSPGTHTEFISSPRFQNCRDDSCIRGVDYMPVNGVLDCPHILIDLPQSNITLDSSNSSLVVFNQTIPIDNSSHHLCGNILKLCASVVYSIQEIYSAGSQNNTSQEGSTRTEESLAMVVVSVVCIALSLICLCITFIIYCLIPQLRSLPGKNTMALIFHLFCAQLIFQVGIQQVQNRTVCRAMGVLIHYFWLTAFGWMAISAYHMCAVFSNMAASRFNDRSAERKTLAKYFILCNVFALVFVISCIVYHVAASGGQDIGYGEQICFLNKPLDIGIFFALPVGLVLTFNVICFIRTVVSIRRVPDMKNAKNKPNRNHVHVYFRLSILLGFTWVFGFVAAVVRTNVWWYVYIILNGLQGVFIFVAYCLNKRTIRQLRARFSGTGHIKYSRPTKSSSSDRTTHSTTL